MTSSPRRSPPPSWLFHPEPDEILTERRLTRLEIVQEDHAETLDVHASKHDEQALWNRAFSVALAGLAAGLAHAKADGIAEFLSAFLKAWKG